MAVDWSRFSPVSDDFSNVESGSLSSAPAIDWGQFIPVADEPLMPDPDASFLGSAWRANKAQMGPIFAGNTKRMAAEVSDPIAGLMNGTFGVPEPEAERPMELSVNPDGNTSIPAQSILSTPEDAGQRLMDEARAAPLRSESLRELQESGIAQARRGGAELEQARADLQIPDSGLERYAKLGVMSAGPTMAGLITGAATRSPNLGAAVSTMFAVPSAYGEAREAGHSVEDAIKYAGVVGGAEAVSERLGFDAILGKLATRIPAGKLASVLGTLEKSIPGRVLTGAGVEGTTEALSQAAQNAYKVAGLGDHMTFDEFQSDIMDSFGAGAMLGGPLAGGVRAVEKVAGYDQAPSLIDQLERDANRIRTPESDAVDAGREAARAIFAEADADVRPDPRAFVPEPLIDLPTIDEVEAGKAERKTENFIPERNQPEIIPQNAARLAELEAKPEPTLFEREELALLKQGSQPLDRDALLRDLEAEPAPTGVEPTRAQETAAPVETKPAAEPYKGPAIPPPKKQRNQVRSRADFDPNYHDVRDFIALNGGLDAKAFKSEFNAEIPSDNMRFFGKPLFRKKGGMNPDQLRERLQEAGFLNQDSMDSEARYTPQDAYDLVDRALDGQSVYHPAGVDVQNAIKADEDYYAEQSKRQAYIDENGVPPELDEEFARRADALDRGDLEPVYSKRAKDRTATPDMFGATQRAQTAPTPRPASGDLFGAPTSRDRLDAAQRDSDARLTGPAVGMRQGDGELFAGQRPEQKVLRSQRPDTQGIEVDEAADLTPEELAAFDRQVDTGRGQADTSRNDRRTSPSNADARRDGARRTVEDQGGRSGQSVPVKDGSFAPDASLDASSKPPKFTRWFRQSKLKNPKGIPLEFNHTTNADFDTFDSSRRGSNTGYAPSGLGNWFSQSVEGYGSKKLTGNIRMENPKVMPLHKLPDLDTQEDFAAYAKELREQGFDGLYFPDVKQAVTFDSVQFKENDNTEYSESQNIYRSQRAADPQTKTPEFKKFFEGSKIVDADGAPLVVYHGTRARFSEFNRGEFGFHFGNEAQARQLGPNLMRVYLSIKNPIRFDTDFSSWNEEDVAPHLVGMGIITEKEADQGDLQGLLMDKGYDGYTYPNGFEGGGTSYAVFSPTQIKSATGNNGDFDAANPSILKSEGKKSAPKRLSDAEVKQAKADAEKAIAAKFGIKTLNKVKGRSRVVFITKQEVLDQNLGNKELRDDINTTDGFYDQKSGIAYVIADSNTPISERPGVFVHELFHANGEKFLGSDGFKRLKDAFRKLRSRDKEIDAAYKRAESVNTVAEHLDEEGIAYLAQEAPKHRLSERLTDEAKLFLNRLGIPLDWLNAHAAAVRKIAALNLKDAANRGGVVSFNKDGIVASKRAAETPKADESEVLASKRTRQDAEKDATIARNEARNTLGGPTTGGAIGWNFDEGRWEGSAGTRRRARAVLDDKMIAWRDVQEDIAKHIQDTIPDAQNVYRLENLMHGRVKEGIDEIEAKSFKPLMEAMQKAGIKPEQVEERLYALHAKERNAQIAKINPKMPDGGSGMTNAEADAILAKPAPDGMGSIIKRVRTIIRQTRERLAEHGIITQAQADAMRDQYVNYVPLRGKAVRENDFAQTGGSAGRGIDTRPSPIKQALGRGAGNRAQNILGEILGDAQRSIIAAEKARVGRAVMRIVLANPNPNLWSIEPVQTERKMDASGEVYDAVVNDWSDPSLIAVRHRGKVYKVQINHAPLANALNMVGVENLDAATRAAGAVNRYFSAVLTRYNPAFIPVNASRDALFGLTGLASEHGVITAAKAAMYYPKAAKAAWKEAIRAEPTTEADRYAREFAQDGGKTGYVSMPSVEELQRKIGNGRFGGYSPTGIVKAGAAFVDLVGAMNDTVENALRLSAYVTLRESGMSREKAAAYAKEMTVNFNRKGSEGSRLNAWFLFYNASMQGAKRVGTLLKNPKTWGYLGALTAAQVAAAMFAMGQEDDEGTPIWDKVPDYVKQRNLVFTWLDDKGDQKLLTIPMPYGFNLFPYLAGRTVDATMHNENRPNDRAMMVAADAISTAVQSFSPMPLDDGAMGVVPTIIRVPLSIQVNRDDFGRQIRKDNPYAKFDVPRSAMGKPDTLELFKVMSTGLNRIGGGDDRTPPPLSAFDLAPEDIEYVLDKLGGGAGKFIIDMATVGEKAAGEFDVEARDIPIAKRFFSNVNEPAAQQSLFYDRRSAIERDADTVRDTFEKDGQEAAQELLKATPSLHGADFRRYKTSGKDHRKGQVILTEGRPQLVARTDDSVYGRYKEAADVTSEINEAMRNAYKDPVTSRERDKKLKELEEQRMAAQKAFNAAWNQYAVNFIREE